jgi:hypothetical protein
MKKILIIIIVLIILAGLGYFGYKYFFPSSKSQSVGGPGAAAQLCDINTQNCSAIQKSADSGTLQVTVTGGGKVVTDLEVDVGVKPGATKYYMRLTDSNGVAVFDGIPAGSYDVYFNGNNFPAQFGNSPLVTVEVSAGQIIQKSIDLNSK